MPHCGSHFENFAIQKKGTLNREGSDSGDTMEGIKASGFQRFFLFFVCFLVVEFHL